MPTDADTTDAILRNARAAERERLRNLARAEHPHLDDDELDDKVRELEVAKLRAAGKRGRAAQQRHADIGKQYAAVHDDILARLDDISRILRGCVTPDTDTEAVA